MATMMKLLSALELADNDNNVYVIVSAGGGGGWQQ
jgi:hypothetical protein